MKKILICGNKACASAAIDAGCRFYAGYPITPQNELIEYMAYHMPRVGGIFIQAESELAAINMVLGAAAAGCRALTSSSSPGISLKQEGISYLAASELPAVIINVMRGGPGLGSIAPAQGDYFQATRGGGHGDYRTIVLAPASCQESYDLTYESFSLADKYRIPVIILSDGMLGQMMEPLTISTKKPRLIKKPWALTGCKGRLPQVIKSLHLGNHALERHNKHLQKKYALISKKETLFQHKIPSKYTLLIVAYGSAARIVETTLLTLPAAQQEKVGFFRPISLWPFPSAALKTISQKAHNVLIVEMSAGQLLEDVRLAIQNDTKTHFIGTMGGAIPAPRTIKTKISQLL